MNNVEIADRMVEALEDFQQEFEAKPFVLLPHDDVVWYLKGLRRLKAIERHLINITSKAYEDDKT